MSDNARAVVGWGILIAAFATGVLFAQTNLPVSFASTFGESVVNAAIGWIVFGLTISIVGLLYAK